MTKFIFECKIIIADDRTTIDVAALFKDLKLDFERIQFNHFRYEWEADDKNVMNTLILTIQEISLKYKMVALYAYISNEIQVTVFTKFMGSDSYRSYKHSGLRIDLNECIQKDEEFVLAIGKIITPFNKILEDNNIIAEKEIVTDSEISNYLINLCYSDFKQFLILYKQLLVSYIDVMWMEYYSNLFFYSIVKVVNDSNKFDLYELCTSKDIAPIIFQKTVITKKLHEEILIYLLLNNKDISIYLHLYYKNETSDEEKMVRFISAFTHILKNKQIQSMYNLDMHFHLLHTFGAYCSCSDKKFHKLYRKIGVTTIRLAGVYYCAIGTSNVIFDECDDERDNSEDVFVGDAVYLIAQENNLYDPYAICVATKNGNIIGYIPKEINMLLENSIDLFDAHVLHVDLDDTSVIEIGLTKKDIKNEVISIKS